MKLIQDILNHKSSEVWSIWPQATVIEALRLMRDKDIGALVVIDNSKAVGIISERDYARKVVLNGLSSENVLVQEIMSENIVSATPHHKVHDCLSLMTQQRFRHLPVIEGDEILAVISIGDLVKSVIDEQQETIDQLEHFITG
jgi:CBS domain-containing protein